MINGAAGARVSIVKKRCSEYAKMTSSEPESVKWDKRQLEFVHIGAL
jgi:hypothetical protein